jgi:hypothetical protein
VVVEGENDLSAPASVSLTSGTVAAGETIDVSVTLKAPDAGGTYRTNFKLRNASGQSFGTGDGTQPFWAQVRVNVTTGLIYDFLVQAAGATWFSRVGNSPPESPLTFGGSDEDALGAAKIKDRVKLENNATSGKVLLTHPRRENDGVVYGIFPSYTIQSGDHLRGRLGFMIPDGGPCGDGNATFEVGYKEGSSLFSIERWEESCDGRLEPIDIDLTDLRGRTVQFILVVRADGSSQDDWAIWNSLRVEH